VAKLIEIGGTNDSPLSAAQHSSRKFTYRHALYSLAIVYLIAPADSRGYSRILLWKKCGTKNASNDDKLLL
jgi:hypothetical protein